MQSQSEANPNSTNKENNVTTTFFWGDSLNKSKYNNISLPPEVSSMLPPSKRQRHRKSMQSQKDGNCCTSCLVTSTSQWRSGPNGICLCNACGLQYRKNLKKQSQPQSESIGTLSHDSKQQNLPEQTTNPEKSEIKIPSTKGKLVDEETMLPSCQTLTNATVIAPVDHHNNSEGLSFFSQTNKLSQAVDGANGSSTMNLSPDFLQPKFLPNDEYRSIHAGTFETYLGKKRPNSIDFFKELSNRNDSLAEKKTKYDRLAAIVDLPFQNNNGPR